MGKAFKIESGIIMGDDDDNDDDDNDDDDDDCQGGKENLKKHLQFHN